VAGRLWFGAFALADRPGTSRGACRPGRVTGPVLFCCVIEPIQSDRNAFSWRWRSGSARWVRVGRLARRPRTTTGPPRSHFASCQPTCPMMRTDLAHILFILISKGARVSPVRTSCGSAGGVGGVGTRAPQRPDGKGERSSTSRCTIGPTESQWERARGGTTPARRPGPRLFSNERRRAPLKRPAAPQASPRHGDENESGRVGGAREAPPRTPAKIACVNLPERD
jgi:hypothetical protein